MTTYYVDSVGGSDSNNGTSTTTPWQTIGKVNSTTFSADDFVYFLYGKSWTDAGLLPGQSGTSGHPITFGAYGNSGNGQPIIDGGSVRVCIALAGRSNITIQNIKCYNGDGCIEVSGACSNNIVEDCALLQDNASLLTAGGFLATVTHTGSNNTVRRTTCTGMANDGFSVANTGTGWLFQNCTSYTNGRVGGPGGYGDAFTAHGTTTGTIENCIAYDCAKSAFAMVNTAGNWILRTNLFYNCGSAGVGDSNLILCFNGGTILAYNNILVQGDRGTSSQCMVVDGTSTITAYNNFVLVGRNNNDTQCWIAGSNTTTACTLNLANNIFWVVGASSHYGRQDPQYTNAGHGTGAATVVSNYNTFIPGDKSVAIFYREYQGASAVNETLVSWFGQTGNEANSNVSAGTGIGPAVYETSQVTPSTFVQLGIAIAANASPISTFIGINAGFDLSGTFTTDYAGRTRVAPWDIGAYEYQAAGGGTPNFIYDIASGTVNNVSANGYGVGGYGQGTYGTFSTNSVNFSARIWSIDKYGQQAIVSPINGTLYIWDATIMGRAYPMYNAPSGVLASFVTSERFVFALGNSANPMQVKWPDQTDYTQWTATVTNTANSRTLQEGSYLVGGIAVRDGISLVWSNTACFVFNYSGDNFVYNSTVAGRGCGLVGSLACCVMSNVAYWMSTSDFWVWEGTAQRLPSDDIRDYVYQDLDVTNANKCVVTPFLTKKEVHFYYPSLTDNTGEISRYVIFHTDQNCWSIGTNPIGSYLDRNLFSYPIATNNDAINSSLVYMENGTSFSSLGTDNPSLTFSPMDISSGERNMDVFSFIPDFQTLTYGSGAGWQITVNTQNYPGDSTLSYGPYTVLGTNVTLQDLIGLRIGAKLIGYSISGTNAGGTMRLGVPRVEAQPSGSRR